MRGHKKPRALTNNLQPAAQAACADAFEVGKEA